MKKLKVLNLYAGIGGNRKLWEDVEVTAVENNQEVADIYQDFFPNDKMVVGDAHEYLLNHFKEFDFIWGSPPCPSHSRARFWGLGNGTVKPIYPDMKLYQEVIFLKHHFKGLYCIENVIPYYKHLLDPKEIDRHLYWSNFIIGSYTSHKGFKAIMDSVELMSKEYGFKEVNQKMLRNCVHPKTGLYILNCARNIITKQNIHQVDMFND